MINVVEFEYLMILCDILLCWNSFIVFVFFVIVVIVVKFEDVIYGYLLEVLMIVCFGIFVFLFVCVLLEGNIL